MAERNKYHHHHHGGCNCDDNSLTRLTPEEKGCACDKCHKSPCDCPIDQKKCECPIRLNDFCVVYTGCNLKFTGIKEGESLNVVLNKINRTIENMERYVSRVKDENQELKDRIVDLEYRLQVSVRDDFNSMEDGD